MAEEDKNQSLIPASTSLIRTGNTIALTDKLILESKKKILKNSFRGETIWKSCVFETYGLGQSISNIIDYPKTGKIIVTGEEYIHLLSSHDGSICASTNFYLKNGINFRWVNKLFLVSNEETSFLVGNVHSNGGLFKVHSFDDFEVEMITEKLEFVGIIYNDFLSIIISTIIINGTVILRIYDAISFKIINEVKLRDYYRRVSKLLKTDKNKLYIQSEGNICVFSIPELELLYVFDADYNWDYETSTRFEEKYYSCLNIQVNVNHNFLAISSYSLDKYKSIDIIDTVTFEKRFEIILPSSIISFDFSKDSNFMFIITSDKLVKIYDCTFFSLICTYENHDEYYSKLAVFDDSSKFLFSGCHRGYIYKWN